MRTKKGFTLVELMVVILIVGILASVAIPILRGRIDAAKWSEGKAMMGSIATAIRSWVAEKGPSYTGNMPSTLAELGFADGDLTGNYFADSDFSFSVDALSPLEFSVTGTAGTQSEAPASPGGMTLTGNANGTSTWTEN
jgi:type IV pilus assembly protein PilA